MSASQSRITFDAINIVKAENIYLRESKKDRIAKRKTTLPSDGVERLKRHIISNLNLETSNVRQSAKSKKVPNLKCNKNEKKLKNISSVETSARESRKRHQNIQNTFSKLNSQVKNQRKPLEPPTNLLGEISGSRSSFYVTPRQDLPHPDESLNPSNLPEDFYECELDQFIRSQYPDFENTSEYDLQEPLVFENYDLSPKTFNPEKSSLRHFKELIDQEELSKNKRLEKNEIELLKDIIKADEQYQKLKRDDYQLLREILLGQLKEIQQQEHVIKVALEKIRSDNRQHEEINVDIVKIAKAEKPLEKNIKRSNSEVILPENFDSGKSKYGKRITVFEEEVDVFFKNVPSLNREIKILKLLGQKLEETLKKSTEKTTPINLVSTPPIIVNATIESISFKHSFGVALSLANSYASLSILGLAQEFKISYQTINELKLERDFYVATDLDNFTLQRTNFDTLRHNPELLLRRLKPFAKNSSIKFNYIEQDPMFFNHFLANICKISSKSFASRETFIPKNNKYIKRSSIQIQKPKMIEAMEMSGGGDHCDLQLKKNDDTTEFRIPVKMETLDKLEQLDNFEKLDKPNEKSKMERKKFKKIRTPLHENKFVSAKNRLLKLILLGSVHLTIVLIVLTAVLYPEVFCY